MGRATVAAAFAAGIAVGALGGHWTGAQPEAPEVAAPSGTVSPAIRTVERLPARAPSEPQERGAASPDLDAALVEIELLRGQLAAFGGLPVLDWPEDLPDTLRPGALEARMQAEVAAVPGLTLERMDCSEFPCVALVAIAPELPSSTSSVAPALAWVEPAVGHEVDVSMACGPEDCVAAIVFEGAASDAVVDARIEVRQEALFEEHLEALGQ